MVKELDFGDEGKVRSRGGEMAPIFRTVQTYIEDLILRQGLKIGEKIPSVSVLAKELKVNPLTVQRAIRELRLRGIVKSQQGVGTFVAMTPRSSLYWVSAAEMTSGDISSYYTELLAACSRESRAMGFHISAHWMPISENKGQPRPWESADQAVGFLFSAIDQGHPAMDWALANHVPFVSFSGRIQAAPWTVTPDWEECGRLAGEWLGSRGVESCLVVTNLPHATFHVPEGAEMQVQDLVIKPADGRKSTVEREAYRIGRHLLKEGKIPQGLYITDDIIARGFTRALLHDPVLARSTQIVVRGFREQVIPLGLDAAFVTWRVADQARLGLELLNSRVQHRETAINVTVPCELIEPEFWDSELALGDHELPILGQARERATLAAL